MAKAKSNTTTVKKSTVKVAFPEWPWNEKQTLLITIVLISVLVLILFSPYLFGPNLFIFNDAGSDTLTIMFPNYVQNARYFQDHIIPGWSFYIGLGTNFYPGYLLQPFQWLMLPFGPESIAYMIGWIQALVLVLNGIVFYKLLRVATFALPVCLIGAVVYAFGGYLVLGDTWYGHAYVVFWMTLSFLGFELLLRRKIWWLFPIPFIFILGVRGYFLILFMTIYSLVRMLDVYGSSLVKILHGYKRMAICGIIAILFALPFVGGEWHRFANSPRVTGNVSYSEKLSDQPVLGISNARHNITAIMRIFSNDTLGTGTDYKGWRNYLEAPGFYIGLITLLLLFQFFTLAPRRQKLIYGALLAFWLFLIIFPWFRYAFYGFAGNYYKGALSLFIPFSFLWVALLGLQEIISGKSINKWALLGALVFWLVLLWYPYNEPKVEIVQNIQVQASFFLIGLTTVFWFMADGLFRKAVYPLLILLISAEALVLSWPTINHRETLKKSDIANKNFHFDDSMEAVKRIKERDQEIFYRMDKVYGSIKTGYNDGMVQDYFGSKSYQSHNHKYYVDFLDQVGIIDGSKEANTRWLVGLSSANLLHGLFSIKYLMANQATLGKVDPAIYVPVDSVGQTKVFQNTYYIPFGIPIDAYIAPAAFEKLTNSEKRRTLYFAAVAGDDISLRKNLPEINLAEISLFGTAIKDQSKALAARAMKMEHFSQSSIAGSIEVTKPTVLFLSIPYDKGWKAKDNGKKVNLEKINIGFTGLYLEPGKHKIELHYEPPLSTWGWLGFVVGALCIFLMIRFRKYF
ncbi:MAG TPA: YfhO family protein [Saprospiraceae bacterium]|nr:YfhO family protein [Saprospiraceae bacterium]HQW24812.1 YfhO family protein [Saprospiraceae bacterium]